MQGSTRIDELRQKFHENPRRYFAPLANEYRKAGDPEQAIAICRAHLAQQPGHMSGHVVYAQALYDAKRTDEARSVFEKALALDPDNAIVLRHLGDIAREKGETDEAKHWYSRALDADPQDTEVAAYIAELTEPLTEIPSAVISESVQQAEQPAIGEVMSAFEGAPEAEIEVPRAEPSREPEIVANEPEEPAAPAIEESPWRKTPPHEESPFVTRTMAELYAKQGYRDAALDVYRQLALQHPDDRDIFDRIEELERAPIETPVETPVEQAQSAEASAAVEPEASPAEPEPVSALEAEVTPEVAAEPGPAAEPSLPKAPEFPEIVPLITDAPVEAEPFTFADMDDEAVFAPSSEDLNLPVEEIDRKTPVHFSEVELSSGDAWDTDAWGAGFSSDEEVDLEFESHDVTEEPPSTPAQAETMLDAAGTTDEAAAVEPIAAAEAERAPVEAVEPLVQESTAKEREPHAETAVPPASEPAAQSAEVETAKPEAETPKAEIETPESETETREPEPLEQEPAIAAPSETDLHHLEAAMEPAWSEAAPIEAVPPAEPIEPEPAASVDAEEAHFVAYSPQLPEEKDLPHFAPKGPTVREFFATLGAYRPPSTWPGGITAHAASSRMAPQTEDENLPDVATEPDYPLATDAFANLFPGSEVSEEDSRAAFALSGALAATTPPPARTPATPVPPVSAEPAVPASEQESEEDIRRFREWLDGLAES